MTLNIITHLRPQRGQISDFRLPTSDFHMEHKAPQIVAIDPGDDGWVVGGEPVALIEFGFEGDTVRRLGMPDAHRHP